MSRLSDLVHELIYQYPPGISTHSPCAAGCGCRVYVLGVVGVVECPAWEPQWVRVME